MRTLATLEITARVVDATMFMETNFKFSFLKLSFKNIRMQRKQSTPRERGD
jgi:hypothetical protein